MSTRSFIVRVCLHIALLSPWFATSMVGAENDATDVKQIQLSPESWPAQRFVEFRYLLPYYSATAAGALVSVSETGLVTYKANHPGAADLVTIANGKAPGGGPLTMPVVGSAAPATPLGTLFLSLNVVLQVVIFGAAAYLIYLLWRLILNAWSGASDAKTKMLLSLLGGIEVAGDGSALSAKGKAKLKGAGLLGSLAILAFACIAIWLIGRHELIAP